MNMKRIVEKRVLPVVTIERVEDATSVAEAILAGGLDCFEITLRTPDALKAIEVVRNGFPSMFVGAGTILNEAQLNEAIRAGAQFGLAPGLSPSVVEKARELNFPFIPGVMTPSDVEAGLAMDCRLQKFFPAETAGGISMLRALGGPYGPTGLKFIPLGGVGPANAAAYLESPHVAAIGGSWIADKKLIEAKDWSQITRNAAEVVSIAMNSSTPTK
ncbi:MAG: bifunctional 4-hydroxy-2-oxoglutarate aldolase/2-dehydro-3-deoxy-phosphogluconate aldolase [Planctomycetes bacterium]|nr:bifunctional 4-hydroxy-2-oxoglutarate aldolase/2-dehydro-3-deoxy-phosphogluconate aldolase [Planctomycetota bacterium]